jgi:hypothetical protein
MVKRERRELYIVLQFKSIKRMSDSSSISELNRDVLCSISQELHCVSIRKSEGHLSVEERSNGR